MRGQAIFSALLALSCIATARGEIVVNDPLPITRRVTVQLIQTALDNGTSPATVFGNATQRADIEAGIDAIWAQAGIDILFLPDLVRYNSTFAYQGANGGGTRSQGDLNTIRTNAQRDGILNSDSSALNMFMVNVVPGFSPLGENSAAGLARISGNGIAAFSGDNLLTFANGRDVIASVMAHEIGHNLGLNHTTSGGANLMSSQGTSEQLNQSQINTALTSTSFARSLPTTLAGDYNLDGIVDAADYTTWRDGLDGAYSAGQYGTWKSNFGDTRGASSNSSLLLTGMTGFDAAVPEPTSAPLLALALVTICSLSRFATR